MKRQVKYGLAIGLVGLTLIFSFAMTASANRGNGALGEVYVTSQGLYYDTFVTVDPLPHKGRFQLLVGGETEYGPGDPGYLGGRWWVDDGDGVQEDNGEDAYVLCPLLPPGRTESNN